MKLYLNINFRTKVGENLQVCVFEVGAEEKVHALKYTDNGNWSAEVDYFSKSISYKYQLVNEEGLILDEEFSLHHLNFPHNYDEFIIYDFWNAKNFPENYLNNKVLKNKLRHFKAEKVSVLKKHSHLFRLEAPIYNPNWKVVILGNCEALGNWQYLKTVPMSQTDFGSWETALELPTDQLIQYKYGLMNTDSNEVFDIEYGDNRWALPNAEKNILQIKADHFFRFKSYQMYHAAGVAVPVFSLRTENGFGVGEFPDLKKVADWAHRTNLSVLQILPINDTTANYTWTDSYPYAAISVYALHPQYLSIENLDYSLPKELVKEFKKEKEILNNLIDYEQMIAAKWKYIKAIFETNKVQILKDRNFKKFIKENENWLVPYAAFCLLRDKYKTPNFNNWKTHKKYIAGKISPFFTTKNKDYETSMLHAWVQYQLHLQLKDAVDYTHDLGISVKGDLPIGIYRYSVEAWTEPELFGMDFQAGAPPDEFTDLGQNWEFPTYNWEAMKEDGYRWWKNRFKALEQYFDAMRIDHILGFFRIWRMPMSATQGILGYFYPAVPVRLEEFSARGIYFNEDRYCKQFINDQILWDYFGEERERIHNHFMNNHFDGTYTFKEEFDTQRKLTDYFKTNSFGWVEDRLITLAANVLFLKEEISEDEAVYHPRFNIEKTDSYKYLTEDQKRKLSDLYVDYFFKRQDGLWYEKAMEKLPVILNATDMLICGEDLGLVPESVPQVMDRLGITALKVQRMPSENIAWYNPKNAGYMNVVTASSHDTSTLRQWWHEDRELSCRYFHEQLGQFGTAPLNLETQLAEMIIKQHLYNEAMLAIFPIQEFLATDKELTNPNMDEERINDPAVFPHYWRYRMHINVEELLNHENFNQKIAQWIKDSNRM
ncbi:MULTISPECIES: 4-alpha-glucanotransferase [unclassified Kaistella]|uniref:4-alpha-glucanotransferase n=1 Tax=unclassified Kaistella TaxID=2762626 RepID=UPI0027371B1B|nr:MULTISPECIES: 4-alpha-glucanotransferase [unclassified Kaistella]MDP2452607.1 4-alpha-glucanotransferase [Kaistella sp. SH11-4b]MDP2455515.1 4-alpha-glucanotransferase [Kaistella sp. SH40-3]MDP2458419.1 4-alpha-glucanotransferase [Kaistella sp. SH19-2b]